MPPLTPQQRETGSEIYQLGVSSGLPASRAEELVAAAYAESRLIPTARNSKTGAAGPFQLLSPGYVTAAERMGGVYNVRANTLAILPSYRAYWQQHPNARPGEAAAAVEASGEGPSFYAAPLAFVAQIIHGVSTAITSWIHPASSSVDLNGVDPGLLGRLYALALAIGRPITITSGYRTPAHSVEVGGSANDPHTRGLAVDALIGGKPIGDLVPQTTLARYGLVGGNQAGFDPGKPGGYDPVHVQITAAEATPGFAAAAAAARKEASWNPTHWITGAVKVAEGILRTGTAVTSGSGIPGAAAGAAEAARGVAGGLLDFSGLTSFIQDKAAYAVLYALLVLFALVLGLLGLLRLVGVHPRAIVASTPKLAEAAA